MKYYTTLFLLFLHIILSAQSPQKMSYQAVIRKNNTVLLANQLIGMKISILQGSSTGKAVYVETQTPTTNANGLVTIEIGSGTLVSGNFTTIDWSNGPYFIKTETDPTGGSSYTISGTSQLLSTPYAFYASTAGSTTGHYLGELYGGGVVFSVDHNGQHGLILSLVDLSTNQIWSNVSSTLIGPTAQSMLDGLANSNAIVEQVGHTNSAAKLCLDYINNDYGTGVYSDWYLPTDYDFNDLVINYRVVNNAIENDGNPSTTPLSNSTYWSSTENNATDAYVLTSFLLWGYHAEKNQGYYVRAVRAF